MSDVRNYETYQGVFSGYDIKPGFLDEVFNAQGEVLPHYSLVLNQFKKFSLEDFNELNELAKISFFNQGVTFAVYSDKARGVERIFPFDLFPRIISAEDWSHLERGVIQRNVAINLFIQDIYNKKQILRDGIVPAELIFSSGHYAKAMLGINPVGNIYNHISGTDLIKHSDGQYYVLEDNVRCPSGVSYVLSNREAMKKTLFNLFRKHDVLSVQDYPQQLLAIMQSVAPPSDNEPICVVLTPGVYNSAYYEHSFLALTMGIPLVEGRDLFVDQNYVYMKTIYGPQRVDVIYRRIDDFYIDPLAFNADSVLGIPGLMGAYREGNVSLLNAPGTGAADDKAVYSYVPEIIKYYLGEDPILNNVHTYRCELDNDYKYVLEHMEDLVVKPVDESGGYGILVGSNSTREQREELKKAITANRRKYIAQPIMSLSLHSTYIEKENKFEGRHIDLRTYTLLGKDKQFVIKGGLSRVALTKGSLVVNSSQGGGSKDTWVLAQ
ncbi:circularly permuted type 2 ATP-grasp protein [Adhaeribacter radiodurans]|uniref:Circularly permuted type 2 ATP-grasp protein n=1 Tax=Adhaeribacter radiodurans TaxID=2745197 RepID=A0A7L7L8H8_9BACT|nr:circularly permuted type 2 ATP-grasp protein [Adhaeribacter radiodurans]QMU29136.1 circularly permuted type 2 ATP-grasp protein [Adhaeribacter radiodurans]